MFKQFIYPITQLTLDTVDGRSLQVAPSADVLLVAEAHSERMGHLDLSLRLRSRCDIDFMQIDLPEKISMEQYPVGYDPKDPAKAIARNMRLRIQWNGKNGKAHRASYMIVCGSFASEGKMPLSLSPFFDVSKTQK